MNQIISMIALIYLLLFNCSASIEEQQDSASPETYSLVWNHQVGQKKEFSWKGHMTVDMTVNGQQAPGTDLEYQFQGTFTITEVDGEGLASGQLQLHYQKLKGVFQGLEMDELVEDGKLKRPAGEIPEDARKKLDSMLVPMKVQLTRRGKIEPDLKHPLSSFFNGLWPMVGPILPAQRKKVPVGHAWIAPLQSPQMQAAAEAPVDVEYSFPDVVTKSNRKYAHITLNSSKTFRMGGVDVTLTAKSDGLFDPDGGECVGDRLARPTGGAMILQGRKYLMKASFKLDFETMPGKD